LRFVRSYQIISYHIISRGGTGMGIRGTIFGLTGVLLFFGVPRSTAAQEKVSTSEVTYKSGDETVTAYLVVPDGKGPFPALVVIHEWWGLNSWVRENAKTFAQKGYVALAIDLYRGKSTADPGEAHELMRGVPEDRAVRDLKAAVAYLRGRKDVRNERIGSIGWCMGGGYSLDAALNVPDLAACVINYGRLVTDQELVKKIPCPILGIFGEDDRGISTDMVRKFEKACKDAGKDVTVKIYPGVGHAFMNPNNKSGYNEATANKAWAVTYQFLDRTLKK
jgi:carboxymethylenebutenolidase